MHSFSAGCFATNRYARSWAGVAPRSSKETPIPHFQSEFEKILGECNSELGEARIAKDVL
jgi:hypothetical protein